MNFLVAYKFDVRHFRQLFTNFVSRAFFSSLGTRLALYFEIERNYRKNGYKLLMKRFLGLPAWKTVSDQMIGNGVKNND